MNSVQRRVAAIVLPMLVVALAACGGGSSGAAKVATLNSSGAAGAGASGLSPTTTLTPKQQQDAILSYTSCMRTNGVAMKDPTFDANGNMTGRLFDRNTIDRNSTSYQAAQKKCGNLIQGIGFGRGRQGNFDPTKMQASFNDFTACLRNHGQQVNDITFGRPAGGNGGGNGQTGNSTPSNGSRPDGGFGPPPGSGPRNDAGNAPGGAGFNPATRLVERLGLDITDPKVKAAVDACSSIIATAFNPTGSTTTTAAG
ncbi:MAG: hypothetical protein WCI22_12175 [Actinomycetota bacterium]